MCDGIAGLGRPAFVLSWGYIRTVGMYRIHTYRRYVYLPTELVGCGSVYFHTHLIGRLLCSVRKFWCSRGCWSLVGLGWGSFGRVWTVQKCCLYVA